MLSGKCESDFKVWLEHIDRDYLRMDYSDFMSIDFTFKIGVYFDFISSTDINFTIQKFSGFSRRTVYRSSVNNKRVTDYKNKYLNSFVSVSKYTILMFNDFYNKKNYNGESKD